MCSIGTQRRECDFGFECVLDWVQRIIKKINANFRLSKCYKGPVGLVHPRDRAQMVRSPTEANIRKNRVSVDGS